MPSQPNLVHLYIPIAGGKVFWQGTKFTSDPVLDFILDIQVNQRRNVMVTVKVISKTTNYAVKNSTVALGYGSGVTNAVFTDDNGEVDFDDVLEGTYGYIYVDGTEVFKGALPSKKTISIKL
jgi:hypothetical protein